MERIIREKAKPQEQTGRKGTPDSRDRLQPHHSTKEESRQKLEKQEEIMGRFLNILSHFIFQPADTCFTSSRSSSSFHPNTSFTPSHFLIKNP